MAKKKRRYKKKKKATSNLDIAVITLIVLSILLAVLIYTKSGVIGAKLNEIFGGVLGIMQYVLPIGTFAVAIKLASEGREGITPKLIQYGIAIISLSIVFSVFQISSGELQSSKELSELVKDAYYFGSQGKGGGAVGAVAAVPLAKLLGDVGAVIFCIGTAVILLVFTFGINLSDIINLMLDRIEEKKEERFERREQLAKESKKEEQEETPGQRRKRLREERKIKSQLEKIDEKAPMDNQIKINFGGRIVDGTDEKKGLKKYDHTGENLEPLTKQSKKQKQISQQLEPDVIDANLFKDVEEQKEEKKKAVLQLEHAQIVEDEHYEYPPVELLSKPSKKTLKGGAKALTDTATRLQKTLYSFGVSAKVENVSVGPAITRYELKPAEGVRVSKIANLADDIALNLAAETIRIEAPIPGKQAVGIEVPNKEKEVVHFREILDSDEFKGNKSKLTVGLGKDVAGNVQLADIAKMPHVLIAGSTGSGKSVCINTIITSIIYNAKPSEVKFVMVDPKVVELSVYNGIPHLLIPVVTDPRKAAGALAWAVQEMDDRYNKFASKGVRDLKGYNKAIEKENLQVFVQFDPVWAKHHYGNETTKDTDTNNFCTSGCGIFATVNAIYSLSGHFPDPYELAQYASDKHYRIEDCGTDSGLFKAAAEKFGYKYGFSYDGSSESFKELKEKLKEGDTAIVYLPGHYGTIVDYNAKKDKYLLMDPHYLPKRGTSSFGDWVSQKDLEEGALMVQTFFYYKAE